MHSQKITAAGWRLDNSYARLPEAFYQKLDLKPVPHPELVVLNESLAQALGLDSDALQSGKNVDIFAGNSLPDGSEPLAQAYAGHQFGVYKMLGDGRGLLLGEQITPEGNRVDLHLKGAGSTEYSRGMDGRAALGPMLREYVMSEAMHGLGIPTTRSLAVVKTGKSIQRDSDLAGAIMTRTAGSHIRVGTFQYASNLNSTEKLRALADYTIARHYPHLEEHPERYRQFFKAVIDRQAKLIADWQLTGFIHGVMNTDNMAISGETIDYGPCAFLDDYDPETFFSSRDEFGRYRYNRQPEMAVWNLEKFGEALLPLLGEDTEFIQEATGEFTSLFEQYWLSGMRRKLGLFNREDSDIELARELLDIMQQHEADYTNTFRILTLNQLEDTPLIGSMAFADWHEQWRERLKRQEASKDEVRALMKKNNPNIIPRNHKVEEALEEAVENDEYGKLDQLVSALSNPYAYSEEQEEYIQPPEPGSGPHITYCGT